jgi:hypothetical protein
LGATAYSVPDSDTILENSRDRFEQMISDVPEVKKQIEFFEKILEEIRVLKEKNTRTKVTEVPKQTTEELELKNPEEEKQEEQNEADE